MNKLCDKCNKTRAVFHYENGSLCTKHNSEFLYSVSREGKLSLRTIRIIEKNGRIVLKKGDWFLSNWTNLAAGWDKAHWSSKRNALEFMDLALAFAIAPLYKAKVVVLYPKGGGKNVGKVYHLTYGRPGITPV